jgi:cobalt-zinc-cadmium efflux system outer membrane protein
MRRLIPRWGLILALAWGVGPRPAGAQGPTIDSGLPPPPGSGSSLLGDAPGSGGGALGNTPGSGEQILGGRPGASVPRVPTAVSNPGAAGGLGEATIGIAAPAPQPTPAPALYGSLSLPEVVDYEGPAHGLTLDIGIDRMIRENLDLRAKFFEIPQAQADILQAGLRANPIFYADGQLVPYGKFSRSSAGGPTQYDVNVSYPLDVSRKRIARTLVASRAKRVLEAQYQDAVRMRIDDFYTAFVDTLLARQTVRYTQKSVEGLDKVYRVTRQLYEKAEGRRATVDRARIEWEKARVALLDAEEQYRKTKRVLATFLNLPPDEAESLEVRGTMIDRFPSPPPRDDLRRIALEARPDLNSFRLGIVRAEADVRLALANRFSDIYLLYQPYTYQNNQPYGLKSPTSWALGVTVPLPIYNRNQGGIQRAKLNVTQTQIQLATLERQVLTDVDQAIHEYEISRQAVERIEREILPPAEQVLTDTYRLYTSGEVDIVVFLNAQRDYNDLVKQYLDTMSRHRRSMLALNTVLGQRVLP